MSGKQRHILIHCNLKKLRIFFVVLGRGPNKFPGCFILFYFIFSSGSYHMQVIKLIELMNGFHFNIMI
jgi:hypothetical protein